MILNFTLRQGALHIATYLMKTRTWERLLKLMLGRVHKRSIKRAHANLAMNKWLLRNMRRRDGFFLLAFPDHSKKPRLRARMNSFIEVPMEAMANPKLIQTQRQALNRIADQLARLYPKAKYLVVTSMADGPVLVGGDRRENKQAFVCHNYPNRVNLAVLQSVLSLDPDDGLNTSPDVGGCMSEGDLGCGTNSENACVVFNMCAMSRASDFPRHTPFGP